MTVLEYIAPQFIKEGRLFWLRSPLFVLSKGNKDYYYYNDEEFDNRPKDQKGTVARMKGLGSLPAEVAADSMFNKENQRLDPLDYSEKGIDLLYSLMGEDVQPRKDFIMANVDFSTIKE